MNTESSAGRSEKFVQAVQAYYGKYSSPLIAKLVAKWIDDHPDLDIGMFFEILTKSFSSQYGKQPDVAILEKTLQEHKADIEFASGNYESDGVVYRKGIRVGHYDGSRFIPDLTIISEQKFKKFLESYQAFRTPDEYFKFASGNDPVGIESNENKKDG